MNSLTRCLLLVLLFFSTSLSSCTLLSACPGDEEEFCIDDDCYCGEPCRSSEDSCELTENCVGYSTGTRGGVCVDFEIIAAAENPVRCFASSGCRQQRCNFDTDCRLSGMTCNEGLCESQMDDPADDPEDPTDDPTEPINNSGDSRIDLAVFGYGDDSDGGISWVSGIPEYRGAESILLRVTQPFDGQVLSTETAVVRDGKTDISVSFGEGLRVELDVLNELGERVASGATAVFDFDASDDARGLRLQVAEEDSFAPVGSVITVDGAPTFTQTRFDYRTVASQRWLGRVGHSSGVTSDGRVLVVGGGQASTGFGATEIPEFESMHEDVQIFDAGTGYLNDLAWNEARGIPILSDQLIEPVAFATLTPIGADRFLVVGGFTLRPDGIEPTSAIQIVDPNAPVGERITSLRDPSSGSNQELVVARAMHTASYRPLDNSVVIAGGVGPDGPDHYLDTFEIIDLDTNTVSGGHAMQAARVAHTSTTLGDEERVWLIGGRNANGVLETSELIAGDSSAADANLSMGRFGHRTLPISASGESLLITIGGFTDLQGNASDTFEIGRRSVGFLTSSGWVLNHGRGNPSVVELPGTGDILVMGGRNSGTDVLEAERLEFTELGASDPYEVRPAATAQSARYWPTADIASNGRIVLIGGFGVFEGTPVSLDTVEFYNTSDPVDGILRSRGVSTE